MKRWFQNLSQIEKLAFSLALLLILFAAIKAGYYTLKYGGTDLRADIVGTRAMLLNKSPYFFHWKAGDPETLLNPNDNGNTVNGVTAAPGVLHFYSLISWIKYPTLRIVWTGIQYLMMGSIFFLCFSRIKNFTGHVVYAFLITSIAFLASNLWLENIERGQKYVLYTFLICGVWKLLESKKKYINVLGGALLAFSIYCRPTFIVLAIPVLWIANRSAITGTFLCSLMLLLHTFFHLGEWKDYKRAMSIYVKIENVANVQTVRPAYPNIIEGSSNLRLYNSSFIIGGVRTFPSYSKPMSPVVIYIYAGIYALFVLASFVFLRTRIKTFSTQQAILFGFLLYILSEYFIPNNRGGYNPIQWVMAVIFILTGEARVGLNWLLIITGICFMLDFPFYFPGFHSIGELLLVISLIRHLRSSNLVSVNSSKRTIIDG